MGQHNCTLWTWDSSDLDSRKGPGGEASPPYSPTEPGDSEPEDGQVLWGDDIGHLPTPTRKNLSISVREDSSPGGGPSDQEEGHPCGFCYHEDKSQMCEDCGHITCVACIEIVPHGMGQWRSLCPCCKTLSTGLQHTISTRSPSTKTSSEKGSPSAATSPDLKEGEEDALIPSSVWPSDIDQKLLEVIYKMQEDMHPARFYGLFSDEEDCVAWAVKEGVEESHASRIWAWAANSVFLQDKRRDKAIREDRFKIPQPLAELQSAYSVSLVNKRIMPVTLNGSANTEIQVAKSRRIGMSKEDKRAAKLTAYKEFMYDLYIAAGPRGQHWMIIHDEEEMGVRREVILSKLDKFTDPSALQGKRSNWRRWEQWAKERGICPFGPRELEVARYIRSRSGGGHTAANGVYQALLFLETYVGVRLHTDKDNVIAMGERKPRAAGVASKQAEIATPSIYLRIFWFCKKRAEAGEGGTVVVLGMLILAWMVACIRAKHAQTSWITKVSSRFIHWWCPEGKRRVQGVRVPFAWLIPRVVGPGLDIWPYMDKVYGALKEGEDTKLPFFIPDVDVKGWQDLNADTPWLPRAMEQDKMSKMFRGMCVAVGVAADWAAMMTTYTLRRFAPTCGGAMGYNEEQMQALSSWQEIPQHRDKKPDARARFIMSRHYDGSTDLMSGDLKGVMVVALHYSFKVSGDLKGDSIRQDHLDEELKIMRKVKSGETPDKLEQQWMSEHWEIGKDEAEAKPIKITVEAKHEFSWAQPKGAAASDESEVEEDPSSGSDNSSESSGEEGRSVDEEVDLSTGWFIQTQGGPTHFVWSQPDKGLPVPFCRKPSGAPFGRMPYMCGTCDKLDALTGITKGAHIQCLMLAPAAVQSAWKRFAGDNIVHQNIPEE